jgi:hypothetical protein
VLGCALRAPVWFLAACLVGQTTEDLDGEPLGLVTALLLRGARGVIAPLVPIDDFYAPLLALLVHRQLRWQHEQGGALDAPGALNEAKRQLRSGRWHPQALAAEEAQRYESEIQALLRAAYGPVIAAQLAQLPPMDRPRARADALLRFRPLVALREVLAEAAPGAPDPWYRLRADLAERDAPAGAERLVDELIANRHRLARHGAVKTLLNYVQAFGGPPAPEKTAAVEH